MSDDNSEWWPGAPDPSTMVPNPAFTVQRLQKSFVEGGDWVRGSSADPLIHPEVFRTAVRFSTGADEASRETPLGSILLFTRPYDYSTVEIVWGIPNPETFKVWNEVIIVRSAFGYPSTVNDGQAVYRESFDTLFPDGYPIDSTGLTLPFSVSPIYDASVPPSSEIKAGLTPGRWYYYSLFFLFGITWTRAMVSCTLLPRNHHHTDHLWNGLPPYYRWVDNQQGVATSGGLSAMGDLHRWLHVFGFELDTTKEYVDSMQELHHVDFCPGSLLRKLGENFGLPFESGLGDIRYRGLLAELGSLYQIRGTTRCLERLVGAASKYECDITVSPNLLTHADDADFFEGTGHWASLHPNTLEDDVVGDGSSDVIILRGPDDLKFTPDPTKALPIGSAGRGTLRIYSPKANELTDILLACGDGISYDRWLPPAPGAPEADELISVREIYPRNVGVLVDVGVMYGFSVQVNAPATTEVEAVIMWIDVTGMPLGLRSVSSSGLEATAGGWKQYTAKGTCPEEAHYAVPAVYFTSRTASAAESTVSPDIWITEAALYQLSTKPPPPGLDRLLRVGDPSMRLGQPVDTPPETTPPLPIPYEGYIIGEPPEQ